jgi:cephalosporin hydroxylase
MGRIYIQTKGLIMVDKQLAKQWHDMLAAEKYAYRFAWMGVPIFQEPQDIIMLQQIVWQTKPDLIIETGIAKGGSLIFYASLFDLMSTNDNVKRKVIGIDINLHKENRDIIHHHPMAQYIKIFNGNSIDPTVVKKVTGYAKKFKRIMLCLDSNHSHDHVLGELNAYAPIVTKECYIVVFDTGVDELSKELCFGKPWGNGNSPKSALNEYLKTHPGFQVDTCIDDDLIVTSSPGGWVKRVD